MRRRTRYHMSPSSRAAGTPPWERRATRPIQRRSTALGVCIGLALSVIGATVQPCAGLSTYDASSWSHCGNFYFFQDSGPTAPRQFSYTDVPAGVLRQTGHGIVDIGDLRLGSSLLCFGTTACGYWDRAWDSVSQTHDDFVFTCQDGRSSVTARMNVRVKGHASVGAYGVQPDRWQAATMLNLSIPGGNSLWVAHSQAGGGWPTSSGMFAGIDADVLDGTFTGPAFTVSTNVPTTLGIYADIEPHGNSYDNNVYIWSEMFFDSPGMDGERIGFPFGPPVFDLPEGCTCNSIAAKVTDNLWLPIPIAVSNRSWGDVKALYK